MTTRQVPMRSAHISMVLPGTWANIPVQEPETAERIIAALVRRQVGRDDRLARARRDAKEKLGDVVAKARVAGAFQVALSLEILPGIPFPAAMFLDFLPWAGFQPEDDARATGLTGMLPGAEILELDCGLTARTWRQVDISPGTEVASDTKLEYLIVTPAGDQLLHVLVDAPVECEPEMIVALFDTMVDSIRWQDPERAGDGSTDGSQ
jgi:hypothetical protein